MIKRLFALVIIFAMIFSFSAFCAENENMKEVLASVKMRIPNTEEFKNFESRENTRNGITVYNFMWYNSGDDYKEMSVRVTGSGLITSYNFYTNDRPERTPSVNKPETKEFLHVAKEFSEKINPSVSDKIEVNVAANYESLYDGDYMFSLTHMENGIPVYGNNGSLTLSSDGKTLLNYYISYTEGASYESPEKAIDKETAEKAYYEEIGMELSYKAEYDGRNRKAYLSYIPQIVYGTYIDAYTGKAVDPGEEYVETFGVVTEEAALADKGVGSSNSAIRFSEAELNEFSKLENLISKEAAEKIVRDLKILKDAKATLRNVSTNRDYYDAEKYYYTLSFEGEDYYYANAKLDAVTGKILNFNQSTEYKEAKEEDKEQAKEKINYYLSILCPDETGEGKEFRESEAYGSITHKNFTRYVNDIPYNNDGITISVSAKDGYLSNYSYNKTDMEFPSPEGIISEEVAAEKMFDLTEYNMYYYPVADKEGKVVGTYLFYMIENSVEIDAFSGEKISGYEELKIPEYEDIEGHFAEKAIKTLKRFGIGFAESKFRPDDIITQKDYITLLSYAVKRNSGIVLAKEYDAESSYKSAYTYNIITEAERDDDAEVKRIDAAIYFINALELAEIASLPGIYNCPFTDVMQKEGYVSILSGLGVVKGDGTGLFYPEKGVTRGEAAVMIYNYLAR